jgi:hypothetical protein
MKYFFLYVIIQVFIAVLVHLAFKWWKLAFYSDNTEIEINHSDPRKIKNIPAIELIKYAQQEWKTRNPDKKFLRYFSNNQSKILTRYYNETI